MLSRASRHRLGLTVRGARSPSTKAYSPRFHRTVPPAVRTTPSGTAPITRGCAASKSRASEKGRPAAIAALAVTVAGSASRAASRCEAGTGTAEATDMILTLDLDAVVLDDLRPALGLEFQLLRIGFRRAAGGEEAELGEFTLHLGVPDRLQAERIQTIDTAPRQTRRAYEPVEHRRFEGLHAEC